jgi:hypothetical protein
MVSSKEEQIVLADQPVKLHCNVCLGTRRHTILHQGSQETVEGEDGDVDYFERYEYRLARCDGCDHIGLFTELSINGSEPEKEQWPPKVSRRVPRWMFDLFFSESVDNPVKRELLSEIYRALKVHCSRLTVMGVRALLEHIMIECVGDKGSFGANMKAFEDAGFISRLQRDALRPVVETGHASTHRGFKPTEKDIDGMLDVLENVVESIYISGLRSRALAVPPKRAK